MQTIRIHNSISLDWAITRGNLPLDLTDIPHVVRLRHASGTEYPLSVETSGHHLHLFFAANDQRQLGKYSLVLTINPGTPDMAETDHVEAFELVRHSKDEGGQPDVNLQVATISLTTELYTQAEADRREAELARQKAEADRIAAESARAEAEQARITAESLRAEAESSRDVAEFERGKAEEERIAKEAGRLEAEKQRDVAEAGRIAAEDQRLADESDRDTAEELRVLAELQRSEAESQRISDESLRDAAEASREVAESSRSAAERQRREDETARVGAEADRIEAESARQGAEVVRQQTTLRAEAAAESAETAAFHATAEGDRAKDLADHPTKIGVNGNWWEWDPVQQQYVDTGILAQGGFIYPTFSIDDDLNLIMESSDEVSAQMFGFDERTGEFLLIV